MRFFQPAKSWRVEELVHGCQVTLLQGNPNLWVHDVVDLDHWDFASIAFARTPEDLEGKSGAVLLVPEYLQHRVSWPSSLTVLVARKDLLYHWMLVVKSFYPDFYDRAHWEVKEGHFNVGQDSVIHSSAVIGEGAVIGDQCIIGPQACLGPGVHLGNQCSVGVGASVLCTETGDNVVIGPGARIGQRGFGFIPDYKSARCQSIPQIGSVYLEDGVHVGANSTIDRGALWETRVGAETHIDNLVHLGHNVQLGKMNIIVAQVGIAGSTVTEDEVVLGGQVGVAGHLRIARGTQIAAKSGVLQSVTQAFQKWGGMPLRPLRRWMRSAVKEKKS